MACCWARKESEITNGNANLRSTSDGTMLDQPVYWDLKIRIYIRVLRSRPSETVQTFQVSIHSQLIQNIPVSERKRSNG